ncbi:hypothetical protein [Vibrio mytili]|uniref:hypothetical protein n=1 Tax=Vibrio mytili TaxID=50718 RepID=UPI001FD8001B|nr:hypothetical protein [Vibrio mytili]
MSSRNAGIGNTTIANVAKTMTGAPMAGISRWGIRGNLSAKGRLNFILLDISIECERHVSIDLVRIVGAIYVFA